MAIKEAPPAQLTRTPLPPLDIARMAPSMEVCSHAQAPAQHSSSMFRHGVYNAVVSSGEPSWSGEDRAGRPWGVVPQLGSLMIVPVPPFMERIPLFPELV